MDTVPAVFMEKVCLLAFDSQSTGFLDEMKKIPSNFGRIAAAMPEKMHKLLVKVYLKDGKISVVGADVVNQRRNLFSRTPLDKLNLNFVTHFRVELHSSFENDYDYYGPLGDIYLKEPRDAWRDVTFDHLLRLLRAIRPTRRQGMHPFRYDPKFCNHLEGYYIEPEDDKFDFCRRLLTLQLPFDSVNFGDSPGFNHEIEEFLKTSGPLYNITVNNWVLSKLAPRCIDLIIDKFVPIYMGRLSLDTRLERKQLERLIVKCSMSDEDPVLDAGREEFDDVDDSTVKMLVDDVDLYRRRKWKLKGTLNGQEMGAMWNLSFGSGRLEWKWGPDWDGTIVFPFPY
uniref:FTH domain-containing protein n=1 Tax=Steinernema glaseri TaxID=37863 RepID=A0A1I7YXX7_9BILA